MLRDLMDREKHRLFAANPLPLGATIRPRSTQHLNVLDTALLAEGRRWTPLLSAADGRPRFQLRPPTAFSARQMRCCKATRLKKTKSLARSDERATSR